MAMIPYSNPAGNNQTTPKTAAASSTGTAATVPTASTTSVAANPYAVGSTAGVQTTAGGSAVNSPALGAQLSDIFGSGVGGSLESFLNSLSGTDSQILKEYIASLQPQMAVAEAGVNSAMGAGGVSGNSTVAALAEANLGAQETASIAGESAQLTQNAENLTAQILAGLEPAAAAETAQSGWDTFGKVIGGLGADAAQIYGAYMKG